jgi:hypothetical protein
MSAPTKHHRSRFTELTDNFYNTFGSSVNSFTPQENGNSHQIDNEGFEKDDSGVSNMRDQKVKEWEDTTLREIEEKNENEENEHESHRSIQKSALTKKDGTLTSRKSCPKNSSSKKGKSANSKKRPNIER